MNGNIETKSEIRARINELAKIIEQIHIPIIESSAAEQSMIGVHKIAQRRMIELQSQLEVAEEDLSASIIRSHKAICKVKQMDEKAAYGNDPAVYYTLGICGEAGEMANAIVKAQRNGADKEKVLAAVKSELPDVIIYSFVLAYVLDIDLSNLVNEKVEVVIDRAVKGYYGSPLIQ